MHDQYIINKNETEPLYIASGLNNMQEMFPGVFLVHYTHGKIKDRHAPAVVPGAASILANEHFIKLSDQRGSVSFAPEKMDKNSDKWMEIISVDIRELAARFSIPNGEVIWLMSDPDKELLGQLFDADRKNDLEIFSLRAAELLVRLSRVREDEYIVKPADLSCTPRQAIVARAVCGYIMNHIERHVTVDELAEIFRLSQTQIKQSYSKYYGESIFRHSRKLKLWTAYSLLRETDMPISEIASLCGYIRTEKFSKAFTDQLGISPAEFRKK